ncbi:hypothetical protein ACQY0O_007350 [Thecaphora frezii]
MFGFPVRPQKRRRYTTNPNGAAADHHPDDADYDDPREAYGNQSLPVGQLPPDFDGIPLDGEQYLATVRLEAASQPSIFYAAHNPYAVAEPDASSNRLSSASPSANDKANLLRSLSMPSEEWRQAFLEKFCNMREALSNAPMEKVAYIQDRLPKPSNADGWYAWIHGKPPPDQAQPQSNDGPAAKARSKDKPDREEDDMDLEDSEDGKLEAVRKPGIKEPSGGALRRLNTDHVLGILEAFPYWLAHGVHLSTPHDSAGEDAPPVIQPLHARWLFALLAWLDSRLVSEQISVLRTLARACIAAISLGRIRRKALESRKKKQQQQSATPSEEATSQDEPAGLASEGEASRDKGAATPADTAVEAGERGCGVHAAEVGAWMAVTAIAGIWGQADLWDDAVTDLKRTA